MNDYSSAAEGVTSSASSVATKTAVVGGSGLGVPAVVPFMQAHHVAMFSYAEICQLIATFYILWQLYHAIKKKFTEIGRLKMFKDKPMMGGNPGTGSGSSSGSSSSSGSGSGSGDKTDN